MAESPFTTPKRKRGEMLSDGLPKLNTTTQFTFDPNSTLDDGNASPRTRVAHRFRALGLGSGGGASGPSTDQTTVEHDADDGSRKRIKLPDVEMRDADADSPAASNPIDTAVPTSPRQPQLRDTGSPTRHHPSPKSVRIGIDDAIIEQSETIAYTLTTPNEPTIAPTPSHTPPSPRPQQQHQQQPPPRNRPFKRAGTPPFPSSLPPTTPPKPTTTPQDPPTTNTTTTTTTTTTTVTDPLRASLTWHDSEITIYDPDDSDDDGTGINGIGFKPTPAIAYARAMRRRQQLAEYRKREEREARAKRSQRRRGAGGGSGSASGRASPAPGGGGGGLLAAKKGKGERRRVRFLEGGAGGGGNGGGGGGGGGEMIGV